MLQPLTASALAETSAARRGRRVRMAHVCGTTGAQQATEPTAVRGITSCVDSQKCLRDDEKSNRPSICPMHTTVITWDSGTVVVKYLIYIYIHCPKLLGQPWDTWDTIAPHPSASRGAGPC